MDFDEDHTGVIVWSSTSDQVTVAAMSFISSKFYHWTSVFCYVSKAATIPSTSWISRCCDAFVVTDSEGLIEVGKDYLIYENRQEDQQSIIFSTGKVNVACNKCGLVSKISNLEDAIVELVPFNKTLICTSVDAKWYFTSEFFNGTEPRTGIATGGFEFSLLEDVRNHLGFKYYVQEPPGKRIWGDVRNGSWYGALDQLLYRNTHFAIGDLTLVHPRNVYFDFTYPHDFDVLTFVSKLEKRFLSSVMILQLMDSGSWISLVASTFVTCLFLVVACKVRNIRSSWLSIMFHGAEFIYGALVQPTVRFPYEPESKVRTVLFIWTTTLFVLGRAISACLVMLIATPGFVTVLDTMAQWATFLKSNPDSRVCMSELCYHIFDESSGLPTTEDTALIAKFVHKKCFSWSASRIIDEVLMGENGFWLGEQLDLTGNFNSAAENARGSAMAHLAREHLEILFQGILLQRGCAFSISLQNTTRSLFETGHVNHYKKKLNLLELSCGQQNNSLSSVDLSRIGDMMMSFLFLETSMIVVLLSELSTIFWRARRPYEVERARSQIDTAG